MTELKPPIASVVIMTSLALIAFAANSLLCRMALAGDAIDPASFTAIRLASGIVVLVLFLLKSTTESRIAGGGTWTSAFMLFAYAACFSFAYVHLDAGIGALILFGMVQVTLVIAGTALGEKLTIPEWAGLAVAFFGLLLLVLPGLSAPTFRSAVLMGVAGIAWGLYTFRGRDSVHPIADTAYNFLRTMPFVIALVLLSATRLEASFQGIFLAILSGAVASAMGYSIWYWVLRWLSNTESAVVQLAGPILAGLGGVMFLSEQLSARLLLAACMVLGGILLVVLGRHYKAGVR